MSFENNGENYVDHGLANMSEKPTRVRIRWAALALRDVVIREMELKDKQLHDFEVYTRTSDIVPVSMRFIGRHFVALPDVIVTAPHPELFADDEHELTELQKAELAVIGAVDGIQATHHLKPRHARKALAISRHN